MVYHCKQLSTRASHRRLSPLRHPTYTPVCPIIIRLSRTHVMQCHQQHTCRPVSTISPPPPVGTHHSCILLSSSSSSSSPYCHPTEVAHPTRHLYNSYNSTPVTVTPPPCHKPSRERATRQASATSTARRLRSHQPTGGGCHLATTAPPNCGWRSRNSLQRPLATRQTTSRGSV